MILTYWHTYFVLINHLYERSYTFFVCQFVFLNWNSRIYMNFSINKKDPLYILKLYFNCMKKIKYFSSNDVEVTFLGKGLNNLIFILFIYGHFQFIKGSIIFILLFIIWGWSKETIFKNLLNYVRDSSKLTFFI